MTSETSRTATWETVVLECLDDMQAGSTQRFELSQDTGLVPTMIITTARNQVHAKALVDAIVQSSKSRASAQNFQVSVEGYGSPWAIVSGQELWVHVMSEQAREYYQLEDSWDVATKSRTGG